ncbi:hypothetical protein HS088_TW20G00782 [Tripterygium wilfordii]|uniref:Calcineurin-like phosphoesterase domain-containing protein n=1 Tax=Tripterygium wilfordii TaxID=458696 RepID=A0A7J7C8F1_TRIWF|nr:acyl-carrier-protein phosphodiesterase PptH-like [Tripterygium wilfordii]KAF5730409.1 hypothetical protein HS088_TW20G00782 [Tripterygium wilfordii]
MLLARSHGLYMVVSSLTSCLSLFQQPSHSDSVSKQIAFRKYRRYVSRSCIRRPHISHSAFGGGDTLGLRAFVLSDLHTDCSENMTWVKSKPTKQGRKDVLLVAGDVAETYGSFVLTMSLLKERFEHVLFVPGNHDLWCRRDKEEHLDSLEKLDKLLDACSRLGVVTSPILQWS